MRRLNVAVRAALVAAILTTSTVALPAPHAQAAVADIAVWGDNPDYAEGNPTPGAGLALPDGLSVTQLSAADNYGVALLSDGSCRWWGTDYYSFLPTDQQSDADAVAGARAGDAGAVDSGVLSRLAATTASTAGRSCGTGFTQVAVANQWLLGLKRDGSVSILGKGDLLGAFATFAQWVHDLRNVVEIRTAGTLAVALVHQVNGTNAIAISPSASSGSESLTCALPAGADVQHVDIGLRAQGAFIVASSGSVVYQCGMTDAPASRDFGSRVTELRSGYDFAIALSDNHAVGVLQGAASTVTMPAGPCYDVTAGGYDDGSTTVKFAYCLRSDGTIAASTNVAAGSRLSPASGSGFIALGGNSYGAFAVRNPPSTPAVLVNRGDSVDTGQARCLGLPGASAYSAVASCATPATTVQQFQLVPTPQPNVVLIKNVASGTCLAHTGANTAVRSASCDATALDRQWTRRPATVPRFVVFEAKSLANYCLTPAWQGRLGASVACNDTDKHQQWGFDVGWLNSTAASVTSLNSSLNPAAMNEQVTLTARVTLSDAPTVPVTGSVTFTYLAYTGTSVPAWAWRTSDPVPLDQQGYATLSLGTSSAPGNLAMGTNTITVNFLGNVAVTRSSASLSQTVNVMPAAVFTYADGQIVGIDPRTMTARGYTASEPMSPEGDAITALPDGQGVVTLTPGASAHLTYWTRSLQSPFTLTQVLQRPLPAVFSAPGAGTHASVQAVSAADVVVTSSAVGTPYVVRLNSGDTAAQPAWPYGDPKPAGVIRLRVVPSASSPAQLWYSVARSDGSQAVVNATVDDLHLHYSDRLASTQASATTTGDLNGIAGDGPAFFRKSGILVSSAPGNPPAVTSDEPKVGMPAQGASVPGNQVIWASAVDGRNTPWSVIAYRAGSLPDGTPQLTRIASRNVSRMALYVRDIASPDAGDPTTVVGNSYYSGGKVFRLRLTDDGIDIKELKVGSGTQPVGIAAARAVAAS